MIDSIEKHLRNQNTAFTFSVLIPTWNNLEYLKNCVRSIQKNSTLPIQLIIIVNEGSDGTKDWVQSQEYLDYIASPVNLGICYGLNSARSLVKSDYIVYVNDDMYLLPNWDVALYSEIQSVDTKSFMLSSTMIEPVDSGNRCVVVRNFGTDIVQFDEQGLLGTYTGLYTKNWSGSTWPPNLVHVDLWDMVGGLSIEFSPGMYSDPDFSRKLYEAGVRHFKGVGNSLVYHFGSRSVRRIKKNSGRDTFLRKWGISSRTFTGKYLRSGDPYCGKSETPHLSTGTRLINRLKQMLSCWHKS